MLLPLIIYFPTLISITAQTLSATRENEKTYTLNVNNVTRNLSLSEAAQIYGKMDTFIEGEKTTILFPFNILIPFILVISTGLLAILTVKVIMKKRELI